MTAESQAQSVSVETISTLRDFGLTDYEARSYATLLRHGVLTARRVAEASGIPRPLVYATLRRLHEKGLVNVRPESITKYVAMPASAGLKRLLDEKKRSIETLNGRIQQLEEQLQQEPISEVSAAAPQVEIYHGKRNARHIISRLISNCKNEIRFVTTNPDIAVGGSWKRRRGEHLKGQLLIGTAQAKEQIMGNLPEDIEVRFADNLRLNLVIADRSSTIILDMDAENEPQRALLIAHPEVVSILNSIVDLFWDTASAAAQDRTATVDSKSFRIIKGLQQELKSGIESSKRTILWSCWNEDWLLKLRRELVSAARRNVDVRLLTRPFPTTMALEKTPNLSVKWITEKVPSILVFDDKCIFIVESDTEPVLGLLTDHQGFAAAMGFWFMSFEH